jgi:ABC-2 type transport system ATP-binding protein
LNIAIETINLTKIHNNKNIISNLNLKIPEGKIHGLIGSNGAGKTTTLKILCGLIQPTSGLIKITGLNIKKQRDLVKKMIGYLPEDPSLYNSLTVKEMLEYIGTIHSISGDKLESRMKKYTELFDIQPFEEMYIESLSLGEKKRVAVCSLMIREPEIYLLDEPMYALDPRTARTFRKLLIKKKNEGSTILISTHLLDFAEKHCDSVTILEKGLTIMSGKIDYVKEICGSECSLEDAYIEHIEKSGVKSENLSFNQV